MKKSRLLFVSTLVLFLLFAFYAGKRWYSHESDVNAKLWAIQSAAEEIADSLKETDIPYIDRLQRSILREVLSMNKTGNNAYLSLASGEDIRILIVGDSISAQDWAAEIGKEITYHFGSECEVNNLSMGGNTSYAGYVRTEIMEKEKYDLALICFGQNDEDEDFAVYYEALIRSIIKKNPGICMIAVLESSQRVYTQKINSIMEIAEYYNIALVDMIEAYGSSEYSYQSLSPDGVHPGELGKKLYLDTLMNIIFENVEENVEKIIKKEEDISHTLNRADQDEQMSMKPLMNPEADIFKECLFVPAEQFERTDDVSFSVSGPVCRALIGIYCARVPGENSIRVFCNGEQICEYNEFFDHSFSQEMIFLLDTDQHEIEGEILVVAGNREQAESFRGLIIHALNP